MRFGQLTLHEMLHLGIKCEQQSQILRNVLCDAAVTGGPAWEFKNQ